MESMEDALQHKIKTKRRQPHGNVKYISQMHRIVHCTDTLQNEWQFKMFAMQVDVVMFPGIFRTI